MRIVTQGNADWRRPGIGSGDAAALMNVSVDPDDTVLLLWAKLVSKRERGPTVRRVQLDQGGSDWLKWRKLGVGGSEVGCVLGGNPYSGSKAKDVWGRKLPDDAPGAKPEVNDNPAMRRGRELEGPAREMYERLYGWKAEPVCILHDLYDYCRCSLDGIRDDGQVALEIKCSGVKNHTKYLAIAEVQDPVWRQQEFATQCTSYWLQCLYQLAITGAKVTHFVGYNPDMSDPADRFCTFEVYPQPREMERLIERVRVFWEDFVVPRVPPPPEWNTPIWTLPEADDILIPTTSP